jgi:hypothetical protein
MQQWFGPAACFLVSACSYLRYRFPEEAMRWKSSWSWPQRSDLTPQGMRRLSGRYGEVAAVCLLVGIVWSGAIVLSAGEEDRPSEFEQCVDGELSDDEELSKEYPFDSLLEEICESRYPALVGG